MRLRRTAAAAAIAAMGGLATLGTAPAASAAAPSVTACPGNGKIAVSISNLDGASIAQGDSRETVVTLQNDTGHDVTRFLGILAFHSPIASNNPPAIGVDVKVAGKWQPETTPAEAVYVLTPFKNGPFTLAKGATLRYDLRLRTSAQVPTWPGAYEGLVIAGNQDAVAAKLNSPDYAKNVGGLVAQAVQSADGNATASPEQSCSNDFGGELVAFKVTKAGSTPTGTPSPSPTSSPSTQPVSSVSTSPAAAASASASSTGGGLAETGGGNSTLPIAAGATLVVLGAGAVALTRRRKAARH
jgi:LPXTG-motif cell wall-anchored protein